MRYCLGTATSKKFMYLQYRCDFPQYFDLQMVEILGTEPMDVDS